MAYLDITAELVGITNGAVNDATDVSGALTKIKNALTDGATTLAIAGLEATTGAFSGAVTCATTLAVTGITTLGNALNETQGTSIASAASINLGAATGNMVDVTGTTTIAALGTVAAGVRRIVRFTGALTLTHNGTSLQLPGAANIVTVAGDAATFVSLGSGNWKCVQFTPYSGAGIKGVLGYVQTADSGGLTCTTDIPVDSTAPQITEGDQVIALTYYPKKITSKLQIDCIIPCMVSAAGRVTAALFVDDGPSASACETVYLGESGTIVLRRVLLAETLAGKIFTVRVGPDVGGPVSVAISSSNGGATMGGRLYVEMSVTEYAQ